MNEGCISWMTKKETECIEEYARIATVGIMELGTFRGGTTKAISRVKRDDVPLFSVDIYGNKLHTLKAEEIYHNELYYKTNCFLIVGNYITLFKFWHPVFDLLIIDADHNAMQPIIDVQSWGSKLINGGYMFIHDAMGKGLYLSQAGTNIEPLVGCTNAVDYAAHRERYKLVEQVDTLAVLQKTKGNIG